MCHCVGGRNEVVGGIGFTLGGCRLENAGHFQRVFCVGVSRLGSCFLVYLALPCTDIVTF